MREPWHLNTPLRISIPHPPGRAEARRRIEDGFSKLALQLPGGASVCNQRRDGDRLAFSMAATRQTVTGGVEVLDSTSTIDVQRPGRAMELRCGHPG